MKPRQRGPLHSLAGRARRGAGEHGHEHEHAHGHEHDREHEHEPLNDHQHVRHGHEEPAPRRAHEPLARGAGRGQILFLDAFSGAAGDMLLAGLLDLGVPREAVDAGLRALPLEGYELRVFGRTRGGIAACGLDVALLAPQPSRDYAAIRGLLAQASGLPPGARALAERAFALLADAEAEVHGCSVDEVHFHEVGAVDSIVDIVGVALALDHLGADVHCSPLPIGRGLFAAQHGPLPSPAPATLLCLREVPTYDAGIDAELVTPTGACLIKAVAQRFTRWPELRALRVGWGAGARVLADRPNLLRLVLGERSGALPLASGSCVLLELNVDDMSGELSAVAMLRAQEAGALDVWSTPIGMKKGRPALMLSALARHGEVERVARALLAETTSLGLRLAEVQRIERARRMIEVATPYGPIAVKIAGGDGLPENAAPEYEICRAAAEAHGVPVKQVYAAALAAYVGRAGQR